MAESVRKQIVDAFVAAIRGVSVIGKVTTDRRAYTADGIDDYPKVHVGSEKPEVERAYYPHPTSPDMHAMMEISVEGVVQNITKSSIAGELDTLMQAVEQAIVGDETLTGLVLDIILASDEIVEDLDQGYGIFSGVYQVEYLYNHNSP
jgi:hypothetical protein